MERNTSSGRRNNNKSFGCKRKNYYRHTVSKNLKIICQSNNTTSKKNKVEWKIITNIKRKMTTSQLVMTKANKGKTLIILTQEEYKQETKLCTRQFKGINENPTKSYQKR
jgi:hypothetical protein